MGEGAGRRVWSDRRRVRGGRRGSADRLYRGRRRYYLDISTNVIMWERGCIPSIGHQRWQHLLRYKAPSLSPYRMRQNRGRSHPPRPLRIRNNMWVYRPRIAHVVDSPPEKGFDWCSEIKGDHPRSYGPHTSGLHTRRWCFVGGLRGVGRGCRRVIGGIASERDSSARTGAGRHRIVLVVGEVCGSMGGVVRVLRWTRQPRGMVTRWEWLWK